MPNFKQKSGLSKEIEKSWALEQNASERKEVRVFSGVGGCGGKERREWGKEGPTPHGGAPTSLAAAACGVAPCGAPQVILWYSQVPRRKIGPTV